MEIVKAETKSPLVLSKVVKEGGVAQEYILLKVVEDCNLGLYAIADNTYDNEGDTSNKHPHIFWFPPVEAKAGERVCVWTKAGSYRKGKLDDNKTPCHYFFWNLKVPVWNDERDKVLILRIARLITYSV